MPTQADRFVVQLGKIAAACAAVWVNAAFSGCSADRPLNPSFPITLSEAKADLRRMREDKRPLERPVLICAGIFDPGAGSKWSADMLRETTTTPELVIDTGFWGCDTFDAARERVLRLVERRFGPGSDGETIELDVVGVSMGGLVARYAALPVRKEEPVRARLRMRHLHTIGTPHRGAEWWDRAPWDQRAMEMRPGGPFIHRLNREWKLARENGSHHAYEVFAYVRLGDRIVGEANAAGPDGRLWWVGNPALEFAHMQAFDDPRLVADIARRLRGEETFSREPAVPLPVR